jgi:hypothetical protein
VRGPEVRIGLPGILYLVIGALVARSHHYFAHTAAFHGIVAAALAVVLWPLVAFFGVAFHVS